MWPAGYTQVKAGNCLGDLQFAMHFSKVSETEGGGEKNAELICSSTGSCFAPGETSSFQLSSLQHRQQKLLERHFFRTAQWVLIAQRRNILLMFLGFSATKSPKLSVRFSAGETQYSRQDCSTTFHSLYQLKSAHPWMLKKSNFESEICIYMCIYIIHSLQFVPMEVCSKATGFVGSLTVWTCYLCFSVIPRNSQFCIFHRWTSARSPLVSWCSIERCCCNSETTLCNRKLCENLALQKKPSLTSSCKI